MAIIDTTEVRNYEQYRAQALASLGEDYTLEDLRNEERFRSKVLDGLGMSYETEDLVNFEKYRLKVLQGLAGGGGGSSDFSTAEVVIVNTTSNNVTVTAMSVMDTPSSAIVAFNNIMADSDRTYTAPLYKGVCAWKITAADVVVAVTGDISYNNRNIIITGNGTITIS